MNMLTSGHLCGTISPYVAGPLVRIPFSESFHVDACGERPIDLCSCSVFSFFLLFRGRGKSAAIGLCLAGSIAYGYSNIFVTAPSPENLATVFEFVLKGFDLLHFRYTVS